MSVASRFRLARVARCVLRVVLSSAAIASAALAQHTGDGFLFARPRGSFSVRAGYAAAAARSDLFAFTTEQLTVGRRDFSGPSAEVDAAFRMGTRTELVVSGSYARASKRSEFRGFVDLDNNPIEQTTTFDRVPITVGIRQYLTSPGRAIGSFVWVPAKIVPFVGISAGAAWYRFRQAGDFIDFSNNEVFATVLTSSGWSPAARSLVGVEYTVSPTLALTIQGNYLWARGRLGSDFSGFDRIDLSGYSTSAGFAARF